MNTYTLPAYAFLAILAATGIYELMLHLFGVVR